MEPSSVYNLLSLILQIQPRYKPIPFMLIVLSVNLVIVMILVRKCRYRLLWPKYLLHVFQNSQLCYLLSVLLSYSPFIILNKSDTWDDATLQIIYEHKGLLRLQPAFECKPLTFQYFLQNCFLKICRHFLNYQLKSRMKYLNNLITK